MAVLSPLAWSSRPPGNPSRAWEGSNSQQVSSFDSGSHVAELALDTAGGHEVDASAHDRVCVQFAWQAENGPPLATQNAPLQQSASSSQRPENASGMHED